MRGAPGRTQTYSLPALDAMSCLLENCGKSSLSHGSTWISFLLQLFVCSCYKTLCMEKKKYVLQSLVELHIIGEEIHRECCRNDNTRVQRQGKTSAL